uniref:Uncharacterized protein n=1 Tax=viral metagenome TaxID=1070528 RepID=A0A6C0KDK6_9ZZZZ
MSSKLVIKNTGTDQFVPIFASIVLVDTIIIILNAYDIIFKSRKLQEWYRDYGVSAMLMDCLIIFLYLIGGRYLLEHSKMKVNVRNMILCTVVVQMVGDLLFYGLFTVIPRGSSKIMDFFKDYAKEIHIHALWSDAVMMIWSILFSQIFITGFDKRNQWMLLITMIYISQYALHTL